jgi:serine/threonine-protein kinase
MSCLDEDAIAALLAGQLDEAGLRDAEEHMDACAECRRLVSELAARDATVADPPPTETSVGESVGGVVDDRFVLEAMAGRGGMGRVFRARDLHDGSLVALKLVDGDDPRFAREARILADLAHPAIVRHVADGTDADGARYLVMEWLEGEDLAARLDRGPLSVADTVVLGRRVAAALGAAHGRGVIHRDVKPSNVVLPEGRVDRAKVVDFGLARATRSTATRTRTGALLGTLGYMAPEQANGGPDVGPAADVFSLGCILYECLTGERAFHGAHVVAILASLLTRQPPRPRARAPHVPRALDALVVRMLARDPRDRPASGVEVEAALASLGTLRAVPTLVRPAHVVALASAVGLAGLAAMGGTISRRSARASVASEAPTGARAAGGSADGAPAAASSEAPRAMTDFPAPPGTPPRAAAEYAAGLAAIRDAALDRAVSHLTRALALDPSLAPAHLRLSLWTDTVLPATESRAHFRAAREAAHRLAPRDRELLDAVEPAFLVEPPDLEEVGRRLRAVARRRPNDVELALLAIGVSGGKTTAADYDGVLRLDPGFAYAWWSRANAQFRVNDTAAARASVDRCLGAAPDATLCVLLRTRIDAREGRCDAMEVDARRVVALENGGANGYAHLANALAARGADRAAVEEAVHERALATADERERSTNELYDLAQTAASFGDFAAAERHARALETLVEHEPFAQPHVRATAFLVEVLEESGDDGGAGRAADAFLRRRPAWRSVAMRPNDDPLPLMLAASARAGLRADADAARARDAWAAAWRSKAGRSMDEEIWLQGWARPARDAAGLAAAVLAMPEAAKGKALLPSPPGWIAPQGFPNARGGRAQLAAGRAREAVATLEGVTRHCSVLSDAITQRRALLWLGQALEASGDAARACDAYGRLVDRWGAARPRSVSAEAARARARALECPR